MSWLPSFTALPHPPSFCGNLDFSSSLCKKKTNTSTSLPALASTSDPSTCPATRFQPPHSHLNITMFSSQAQHVHATVINLLGILTLLTACASANNILLPTALPLLFQSEAASNGTVQAPYFRNVSAGGVWVLPSRRFDIGGRGMSCECFDPDGKLSLSSHGKINSCARGWTDAYLCAN
jgi:hypothetical protein